MYKIDLNLFYFINHDLRNVFFDIIMPIITTSKYWHFLILLGFIILIIFSPKKGIRTFLYCLLTLCICDGLTNYVLKPLFHRLRPFEVLENVHQLVGAAGYSLPSSHAANSFSLALVISYLWRKKWVYVFTFGISFVVSFSRIYVGVHYPFDILAGWLFAVIFAITSIELSKNLEKFLPNVKS